MLHGDNSWLFPAADRGKIKLAVSYDIPFLVTGGNHGYSTTFGTLDNGLNIDMRNLNSVSIDAAANTMTIGGGTIFNQVFDPLYNAGKEIREFALLYQVLLAILAALGFC